MKSINCIIAIVAAALLLSSCHTNEQNYKAAYDKAKAKVVENVGEETYQRVKAEESRNTTVVNGDSLRLIKGYANMVDGNDSAMYRYNVVVAQFKQIFNARSYCARLKQECSLPSYVILNTTTRKYTVVAQGFDKLDEAAAYVKDIKRHVKIKILEEQPWIFESMGKRRLIIPQ